VTKLNQRSLDKAEKMETTAVFKGISVTGDVKGSHNIYLNGEFDGKMDLTALLLVGKTGKLKGQVKAECVIIEGEVEGKVIAKEKVELRATGKYKGEIIAPSVMISDKAFFDGNVKMTKEDVEKPEMSLVEKSAEVSEEGVE
jgi:cytoskeletal protein CcmA (bactofilin family)